MLTWNAKKVENFKEKNEARPGFFDALVWAALAIGMNEIKESNVKEWVYRIERFRFEDAGLFVTEENGHGAYMKIEEKDITPWIGLKTNVSQISNAAFDKRMRERAGR